MSQQRILICIPCHNRWRIAEQCIPTVREGMGDGDVLNLYNDGSDEYTRCFLSELGANNVHISNPGIGIERQRAMHFRDFDPEKFTHLYLTDSDALHDPEWRAYALALQERVNFAPVCLYNTDAHVRLKGNTIINDPAKPFVVRRVAPGISYLLTADHVEVVKKALPHLPDHWHWDWTVPMLLGNAMVVSRTSYVDHIGVGGMHHPKDEGYDGGDRALWPSPWLVEKRKEVVAKLCRAH